MPAAPLTVTALVAFATLLGGFQLAFGDLLDPVSAAVAGAGMVILAIVAASGTLLARGRWAAPTDAAIGATWIGIAVAGPLGPLSIALLAAGALALAAASGPWLHGWLRRLPRADGPPPAAVVLLLALLATPVVAAFASPSGMPVLSVVLAAWSALLAMGLARILPGSLLAARVLHPALCAAAAVAAGVPGGAPLVAVGVVATAAAWRRDVALAIAPAVPRRSDAVAIPPELVPPEILEAAGLDDRGRPKQAP